MAENLQLVLAEDSAEADQTSPCLVCAYRVDLGGGHFAVGVRLTETKAPTCPRCRCALGFDGCNNTPRRGGCVPACRSCVKVLEGYVADLKAARKSSGAPEALHLIESDASSLTKARLHEFVRRHSSTAVADAIYTEGGTVGLATRVVSQKALTMRDPAVATKLRTPLSQKLKRRGILAARHGGARSLKGGHGATGRDVNRARGASASWADRTSLSVIVSGDGPLQEVEAATSSTVQRYRATKVESDGKSPDERAALLGVTRSASRLEASLASESSSATRRKASARADAAALHLVKDRTTRAALKASRSPEEKARLAEEAEKARRRSQGVTDASVSGATPCDGAAVIETTKKRREDKNTTHRRRAVRSRASERAKTGKDHRTTAIDKERERIEKLRAAKKRAREDPDSGRVVYCKHEDCKYHGVPKPFTGSSYKTCACGRRMAFM